MYCLYFMFTNYSCKYHEILGYDHDMYVMKYVCMLRIYISQVSMNSAEIRYIYKVHYEGVIRIYVSIKYRKFQFLLDVIYFLSVSHMMCSWATYT